MAHRFRTLMEFRNVGVLRRGEKPLVKLPQRLLEKKRKDQTNKHNPYDADSEFEPERATRADERRVFLPLPAPSLHNMYMGYFYIFKQLTHCLQIPLIVPLIPSTLVGLCSLNDGFAATLR